MKILDYIGLQSFWAKVKAYVDRQVNLLGQSVSTSLTDGSVRKVGTTTVGGTSKPIYLSSGTPTACSSTVGSGTKPVYMNAGTITASSSTVGSVMFPVYLDSGTISSCPGVPTLVLSGWISNNGTTLGWNASYTRCFDSSVTKSALALTRVSAGVVRIKIPTALSAYITYSGALVHVHGLAANGGRSFSWDLSTSGYITVYCYNGNTQADAAFWIDVFYIHGTFPRLS